MNKNAENRDEQDISRIDLQVSAEVDRWAKRLDVTSEQIKDAVKAVGDRAPDVEQYLKGSRSTTNAETAAKA